MLPRPFRSMKHQLQGYSPESELRGCQLVVLKIYVGAVGPNRKTARRHHWSKCPTTVKKCQTRKNQPRSCLSSIVHRHLLALSGGLLVDLQSVSFYYELPSLKL